MHTLLVTLGFSNTEGKAVAIDCFLQKNPFITVIRMLTLPSFLVAALALLGNGHGKETILPHGWVWVTLVSLVDTFRQLGRCNVEVMLRCTYDAFRFGIPVVTLAVALIFAAISFQFDPGACAYLLSFFMTCTVTVFLNDGTSVMTDHAFQHRARSHATHVHEFHATVPALS